MDVWEAIEKRRTVRVFKKPVPENLLRKLILAGSKAPSGGNSQPWEFIIVNDATLIEKIAEQKYYNNLKRTGATEEAATHQRNVYQNSSVVAICFKKNGLASAAAWMTTLNIALAATAEGICCVTSTLGGEYKQTVQKLLGLPEEYELATVIVMGIPKSIPLKKEGGVVRPDFSWLHINKFGNSK
ncbi:nitroreductase family protein [Chloroflexota bacterium]